MRARLRTLTWALIATSIGTIFPVGTSLCAHPSTQCLVDRIQTSLVLTPEKIEVPPPKSVSLNYSPKQAKAYFKASIRMVEQSFDRNVILGALEEILTGNELSPETTESLRQMRKALKTLRFTFQTFEVHHEIPAKMDKLIIRLGHLDDAMKSHAIDLAQEEAKQIKKELKEKRIIEIFESIKKFEPETKNGFWRWEKSARASIRSALRARNVSAVEFHEVRKTLGRYFTLLNAQQVYHPVASGDNVMRFTNKLYQDLGDFHDKLEAEKVAELEQAVKESETQFHGEKHEIDHSADSARVRFTPELRTGLTQFLESLKNP